MQHLVSTLQTRTKIMSRHHYDSWIYNRPKNSNILHPYLNLTDYSVLLELHALFSFAVHVPDSE